MTDQPSSFVEQAASKQAAYVAHRVRHRVAYAALVASGAFRAPFEPTHGRQAELGLPEPLRLDDVRAEAA